MTRGSDRSEHAQSKQVSHLIFIASFVQALIKVEQLLHIGSSTCRWHGGGRMIIYDDDDFNSEKKNQALLHKHCFPSNIRNE